MVDAVKGVSHVPWVQHAQDDRWKVLWAREEEFFPGHVAPKCVPAQRRSVPQGLLPGKSWEKLRAACRSK